MKLSGNMEGPVEQPIRMYIEAIGKKKMQIIVATFFLLGSFFLSQAVLFDAAVPFFLPIWALARARFRKYLIWVFIGGMVGSSFLGVGQAVIHLLELLLFNAVIRYPFARKSVPLTVVSSIVVIQVIWQLIAYAGVIPVEVQLFIGFEAILAFFVTFFLFMAFPPADRIYFGEWTSERLRAACIIGALAMTGMQGILVGHLSLAGFFIHLTILLAASAGGLSFSTTIAMIIAAIIGLAELSFTGMMAVYGMTGFVAGAFRRFGKVGIATGGIVVSAFFFMYDLTLPLDKTHFVTIGAATVIFLLIPTRKIEPFQRIFFPASTDVSEKRQQWLAERLDDQLSDFQKFAEFMSTLVGGQSPHSGNFIKSEELKTPNVCQSCFRYSRCWESEDNDMDRLLNEWEVTYALSKKSARHRVEEKIKYKCIKFTGLINELEDQSASQLLSGQLQHGRKMLALQLRDVSTHLDKIMGEIKEDLSVYKPAEEEIEKRFQEQGIEFFQIDVLSEEKGARKVICCIPEKRSDFETNTTMAERFILPVLERMYDEPFQVVKSGIKQDPFPHIRLTLGSAVRFKLDYGIVATSGEKAFHAGDAYEVFPIHAGLTAVLLSDGMGQDIHAYRESRKVIRLMRECLDRKMNPETAMHTLHYMMSLNGLDDMYATLDLALIDLQDGRLWSWKAGSMSTYIKRGNDFLRLDSQSVPVGFLPAFSVEAKHEDLKSGDILVMMTDGMFQGEVSLEEQEKALYGILGRYGHLDCEKIADRVMGEMERRFRAVADDRTVLVMKLDHVLPEWSSFTPYSQVGAKEKVNG
ncbi:SpoIIE family protein phosphatase [Sporosarcina sp. G11-34]|uniref:SpoIIE family protein phosphatase n=1 Tax=Sporosarcina sp. G11-34 TaxID=2849605 RepID=UPI0022A95264|nr:SpoIIE family protein phosphatase [Sporosarcina sp. G11-34]MCZ2260585.1 SpoIIE family protein phosphatase [Sporosarcina sp. G11-34]